VGIETLEELVCWKNGRQQVPRYARNDNFFQKLSKNGNGNGNGKGNGKGKGKAKARQRQRQGKGKGKGKAKAKATATATAKAKAKATRYLLGMRNLGGLVRIHRVCTDTIWHWRAR
jgi:hypothetical protein